MNEKLQELATYLDKLSKYELPNYESIPDGIKMEESINYINSVLSSLSMKDEGKITNYMINNYVKAKIISSPRDKTYSREQIAYTLFISLVKNCASLRNIASLIALDKDFIKDKNELYNFYCHLQENANKEVSKEAKKISSHALVMDDSKQVSLRLAYTALKLYVKSNSEKLVADSIMDLISDSILPSGSLKEDKKEKVLEKKILDNEAKLLSKR